MPAVSIARANGLTVNADLVIAGHSGPAFGGPKCKLVPAIPTKSHRATLSEMAGTSPAMTNEVRTITF
jgi:hypothetical protein